MIFFVMDNILVNIGNLRPPPLGARPLATKSGLGIYLM